MPPTDLSAVEWIHGAADCDRSTDPPIQVVAYDEGTYVLRQSKCLNFEAPFIYLLFGADTVLLHDTGRHAAAFARATAEAGHPIRHVLGAHIEMSSRPGQLYEYGATYQPDEAPLPLTVDDLFALDAALDDAGGVPRQIRMDRFAVEPEPPG